jgi:predicted TIM-barrel fold metal-dependent hydrolase
MIIDVHQHLGPCRVFNLNIEEDALMTALDRNGVDAAIVQPYPGAPDPAAVHDRIAALARRYPGRIFGLMSMSPHGDHDRYRAEARRCFVALKIHTIGHAVNPLTPDAQMVYETVAELGVPLMIHTGPGVPFALPSLMLPAAKKYPQTTFILAHSGHTIYAPEAFVIAQECPNIILDTSWSAPDDIKWFIEGIGPERVMMGSDSLYNLAAELATYRALDLDPATLEQVFAGTARAVFRLPETIGQAPRTDARATTLPAENARA